MKQAYVYWTGQTVGLDKNRVVNDAYDALKREHPQVPDDAVSLEFTRKKGTHEIGVVFTWNDIFSLAPQGFDWRDAEPPPDEDPYYDEEAGVRRLPPNNDFSVRTIGAELLRVVMVIGIIAIFVIYALEIASGGGVSRALNRMFGG